MNKKTKKLLNLIVFIILIISVCIFIKSLPNILIRTTKVSKEDNIKKYGLGDSIVIESYVDKLKRWEKAYDRGDVSILGKDIDQTDYFTKIPSTKELDEAGISSSKYFRIRTWIMNKQLEKFKNDSNKNELIGKIELNLEKQESDIEFLKRCVSAKKNNNVNSLNASDIERLRELSYSDFSVSDKIIAEGNGITSATDLRQLKYWVFTKSYTGTTVDLYFINRCRDAKKANNIKLLTNNEYYKLNKLRWSEVKAYYSYIGYELPITEKEFHALKMWAYENKFKYEGIDKQDPITGNESGIPSDPSDTGVSGPTGGLPGEASFYTKSGETFIKVNKDSDGDIADGKYYRVIWPGISQIYCTMKGGTVRSAGLYKIEELNQYIQSKTKSKTRKCHNNSHLKVPANRNSLYYYFKVGEKNTINNDIVDKNTGANISSYMAYVLTWPGPNNKSWNDWSSYKQEAIWKSSLSNNIKPPSASTDGAVADQVLAFQAKYYQEFMNEINKNGGTMNPQDKTKQEAVMKNIDYATQDYIVGPFKIDYVNSPIMLDEAGQRYGYTYGGISDMYLLSENDNRIEIKSFIIDNKEVTPNYFDYTRWGNNYVDIYPQVYPDPNQEFYIKYSATVGENIKKVHVDFQWMFAETTISEYKAYQYSTSFSHKDSGSATCSHGSRHHRYTKSFKPNCKITGKLIGPKEISGAQTFMSAEGQRSIKEVQLEIKIPYNDSTENVSPNRKGTRETNGNLQINLAGYVWEDEKSGKETLVNGIRDNNENQMPGVEVFLHYADGRLVTKNYYGKELINPTVTDNDGYYEFLDLNAQNKYYIEFKYNGQIYQPTEYTGINLAGGFSNATEIRSERNNYNTNLEEIASAPANYKVRTKLYYNVGESNTAWIIGKESSETPYGIKEIYDYVVEKAIENKNYESAYISALNKYGNNSTTKSKLQFIEDMRISAYTGQDTARVVYPIYDQFVESTEDRIINGVLYHALYPEHLQIDFGLTKRETFDLALRKDVQKATVEINGKSQTYTYDTRNNADETDDGTWDIGVRLADAYYNTNYSRELFGSDYQYKASNYDNAEYYGKTKEDELNVYVTYKLTVRNQSQSILGEVTELVDYYDEDYEYINERSYIEIKNGNNSGQHDIKAYGESRYGSSNQTAIAGYNAVYVRGLEGIKLTSGQTAYVYLTFRIKKDDINGENWIRLDEKVESAEAIGVGKENIAEINGYRTYYDDGTRIPNVGRVSGINKAAGILDKDSVPGNINSNDVPKDGNINYNNFEDDTDKAPNIRLILYRENGQLVCRTMDGIVWEDERTEKNNEQVTTVGDGIKQDKETAINGVTVQLVELMNNGTEYIWKEFSSGQCYINNNDVYTPIINTIGESGKELIPSEQDTTPGKYIFKSYMGGNFVVRFIYGDTVKTVLPNTSTEVTNTFGQNGQNAKSYNGQDYKSTTYQEGITQNKYYIWREDSTWANGNETLGKELTTVTTFKPDASNNETASPLVGATEQKGYLYDITASDANANVSDAKDIMSDNNLNTPNYRQSATLNSRQDVIDYSDNDVMNYIAEVLASHEKLPRNTAEVSSKLSELMTETQMTAETGLINVEVEYDRNATGSQVVNNGTTYHITNLNLGLEERPKSQLSINKEVTNIKLTLADGSTLFDATQKASNVLWREHKPYAFTYEVNKLAKDPMTTIREKNTYDAQYGLIQLTMDEELMHGATIKISYKITVTNVGDVDYKDNSFYYTGKVSDKNTIVKTTANQVIDYIANNLQFYAIDNSAWKVISQEELLNGPVNMTLANEIAKYNTIITTSEDSNIAKTALVPIIYDSNSASVSDDLVLTQLITSENETDDLTYRNIVEVVRTSNDVGRRNAYSVVGNQDPTSDAQEVDTDVAEIVKILPPYGNNGMIYIIATIIILSSVLLIGGIIFIKKKVLR